MKRISTIFLLLLTLQTYCQVIDNFDDGNFSADPTWLGDTQSFIVNDELQLQLNAADAGTSLLYTSLDLEPGDLSYTFSFEMDFAPSDNNKLRIYLAAETADLQNGYFLEMGENGSDDAINLFQVLNGEEERLGSATMGAIGAEPVIVDVKIEIIDGEFLLYASYDGSGFFGTDPEIISNSVNINGNELFALVCTYSSSRTDKFFFDDINIDIYRPDLEGPELTSFEVLSDNMILVQFNEGINAEEAQNLSNYYLTTQENDVTNAAYSAAIPNQVTLTFENPFSSNVENTLVVAQVIDLLGNETFGIMINFLFAKAPQKGDIIINEILTNPIGSGSDFFEIYNKSSDNINLQGTEILNKQNGRSEIMGDYIIPAKSYLAFTPDVSGVIETYEPLNDETIVNQDLPAFNNDEANISLINIAGDTLDSFDYFEDWHLAVIDDTDGVSLERVSFDVESNLRSNWHSSASTNNYATPGYVNSSFLEAVMGESAFTLTAKSFSPNQDGMEDLLGISYNLEKSGYISNVKIYDSEGFEIRNLHRNQSLGTSGVITWDGLNDDGVVTNVGIYIARGEIFHPDGDRRDFKLAFALLDFLD